MKVTLVIYGLQVGGAERVMSILANYWATHGWDVTLILLLDRTHPPFYPLAPEIHLKQLGIAGDSPSASTVLLTGWHRIKVLREAIVASEPDVVISFLSAVNVFTLIAGWKLNIPIIICEHTYPAFTDVHKIWQLMMRWTYRHADLLTLLTQNALPFYPAEQGYRAMVMPNPVLTPSPEVATEKLLPTPTLIALGRLHPVKGFDILIEAFHRLRDKYPDWHLTILGEGAIRAELEELRDRLQLGDRIHLPGQVQNVNAYLRQSDIFVMSSRFEGFPMALCEAMACGVPVLATDCLSGPRDIIQEGVDGMLVATEDVDALVAGLDALMSDPAKRQQLAQNAPKVLDRFGLEQVMAMWTDAIKQTIDRRTKISS